MCWGGKTEQPCTFKSQTKFYRNSASYKTNDLLPLIEFSPRLIIAQWTREIYAFLTPAADGRWVAISSLPPVLLRIRATGKEPASLLKDGDATYCCRCSGNCVKKCHPPYHSVFSRQRFQETNALCDGPTWGKERPTLRPECRLAKQHTADH